MIIENIISSNILKELVKVWRANIAAKGSNYQYGHGMEKVVDPWQIPVVKSTLDPILSKYIDTTINVGDTFFKHYDPYFPHTDNHNEFDTQNVLIPLQLNDTPPDWDHSDEEIFGTVDPLSQSFIIFNQTNTLRGQPQTWLGDYAQKQEKAGFVNQKKEFPYPDPTVRGLVDQEMDLDTYNTYLKDRYNTRELFYGLTIDEICPWRPGDVIVFNSEQLHCSGKMSKVVLESGYSSPQGTVRWKLGLSLRFKR